MTSSHALRAAVRALVAAALFTAVLPAAAIGESAPPPNFAYWFATATTKVYQTSAPPASAAHASDAGAATLALAAARDEFEGRQIAIRPTVTVHDLWIEPSDLSMVDEGGATLTIPASNVSVYRVGYVYVAHPSTGYKRVGLEPDPLLPMTLVNGERLGWAYNAAPNLMRRGINGGVTQPFYVLFHVPASANPGTYAGTLKVTCSALDGTPAPEVNIPVTLTVYPFSIANRTLKAVFGVNLQWAMYANAADHKWIGYWYPPSPTRVTETTTYKGVQLGGWMKMFGEHRITPQAMLPAWNSGTSWAPPGNSTGAMTARTAVLTDYMGAGAATTFSGQRLSFPALKMPEYGAPSYVTNPFSSSSASSKAAKYYSTMRAQAYPYLSKSIAYPIDEPKPAQRSFVERYGAFLHHYAPGVKYFVTIDGVAFKFALVKNVDAYGQRLMFFFRDYGKWVAKIRNAKKTVWIYSHATKWQSVSPAYLIDQPLTGSRVQGWYSFKTGAAGLLYFNVSAWRPKTGSSAYRDPYRDPLSYRTGSGSTLLLANGDGSLVYPGYYPALGLNIEGAPPVTSLRLEAIRDGIEDYEYLKLVQAKKGTGAANWFVARIIGPLPAPRSGHLLFPPWQPNPATYETVRSQMANLISQ